MENSFYRQELETDIKSAAKEKKIRAAARKNSREELPEKQEILDVLNWMRGECARIEKNIGKLYAKQQNVKDRMKDLVSVPQIHRILHDELEVCELNLSARVCRILRRERLEKASQLCSMTEEELAGIADLEERDLQEIGEKLEEFGLTLKNSGSRKKSVKKEAVFYNGLAEELERQMEELFGISGSDLEE